MATDSRRDHPVRTELPKLRSWEEIYKAHDLLHAIVAGEFKHELKPETVHGLSKLLEVLCWVLNHESGKGFATMLVDVEDTLAQLGIFMRPNV